MRIGLEVLMDSPPSFLAGRRLGLLMNQASVDCQFRLACDLIDQKLPKQLTCLFSPQHGLWGEQQANMIETDHSVYDPLGIPIFSLYSASRCPSSQMLDMVDCIIIDLQDVGTRVYTFIWTMFEVLRACADSGKSVVILDRPNPVGGNVYEGRLLDSSYTSFVGGATIPLRHGCTMAELAQLLCTEFHLNAEIHLIPMQGWHPKMLWMDTGRSWLWPSPNMPTATTTQVYPGQVLMEGVNLSEGRGTTRPFELVGAPFVDSQRWLKALDRFELPGVCLIPTRFQPTFDKWSGQSCQGLDIQIIDPVAFRPVDLAIAMIATAAKLFPQFRWLDPPYEYETKKLPIDILYGSDRLRQSVAMYCEGLLDESPLLDYLDWDTSEWRERISPHQLYFDRN